MKGETITFVVAENCIVIPGSATEKLDTQRIRAGEIGLPNSLPSRTTSNADCPLSQ